MTDTPEEFEVPVSDAEIDALQDQLESIPTAIDPDEFSALAKNFFDLPPKTSVRKAETITRIRRQRIRKILDSEVIPTDKEVSLLTDFIMRELDLLGVKRQQRLKKMQQQERSE